jgi:DNA-binding LacI/PurR family transcriptional regulator
VPEGIDSKLQSLAYRIAYINSQETVRTAQQARQLLDAHPISGIILIGPPVGAEGVKYLTSNVRALIQIVASTNPDLDTVTFDGYRGIRQLVDYLVGRGYRRLGYIAGSFDARYTGFLAGVQAHDLPSDPALALEIPFGLEGWTPDLGYTGAQHLMRIAYLPDAIVCASDRIAIGAIQWLHQHGYRIPDDVAVTGFDNIAESAFTVPALTTVHVHKQLIGEIAAERAVKRIENADEIPLFIQTPTYLVIRQSS